MKKPFMNIKKNSSYHTAEFFKYYCNVKNETIPKKPTDPFTSLEKVPCTKSDAKPCATECRALAA
jgi:hypothetical protein